MIRCANHGNHPAVGFAGDVWCVSSAPAQSRHGISHNCVRGWKQTWSLKTATFETVNWHPPRQRLPPLYAVGLHVRPRLVFGKRRRSLVRFFPILTVFGKKALVLRQVFRTSNSGYPGGFCGCGNLCARSHARTLPCFDSKMVRVCRFVCDGIWHDA